MSQKRLTFEVYEYDTDQTISKEELEAYERCLGADSADIDEDDQASADLVKEHRRQSANAERGFPWRARILNTKSGDVEFEVPHACPSQAVAARKQNDSSSGITRPGHSRQSPLNRNSKRASQRDEWASFNRQHGDDHAGGGLYQPHRHRLSLRPRRPCLGSGSRSLPRPRWVRRRRLSKRSGRPSHRPHRTRWRQLQWSNIGRRHHRSRRFSTSLSRSSRTGHRQPRASPVQLPRARLPPSGH